MHDVREKTNERLELLRRKEQQFFFNLNIKSCFSLVAGVNAPPRPLPTRVSYDRTVRRAVHALDCSIHVIVGAAKVVVLFKIYRLEVTNFRGYVSVGNSNIKR